MTIINQTNVMENARVRLLLVDIVAAADFGARRERHVAAEHYGALGDGLVRWVHSAAAGPVDWVAAGAAAVADSHDDRLWDRRVPVDCARAVQAASHHHAAGRRRAALAHHEQQSRSHAQR